MPLSDLAVGWYKVLGGNFDGMELRDSPQNGALPISILDENGNETMKVTATVDPIGDEITFIVPTFPNLPMPSGQYTGWVVKEPDGSAKIVGVREFHGLEIAHGLAHPLDIKGGWIAELFQGDPDRGHL